MRIKSIIIDDEQLSRNVISHLIKSHDQLDVVAEFSNAIDALKYLNENLVDLVFLDIHMPNFDGFDFMNTINKSVHVILVTSDKNFALKAFEYPNVIDYLVKPINQDRFKMALDKYQHFKSVSQVKIADDNEFYVNVNKKLIKIDVSSICIIEAKKDYILIKTEHKNYLVHSSLKKIEKRLPVDCFLKVHRSFIINTKKIIDIEYNSVLINKEIVPVSRTSRPELIKQLNLL